MSVKSDNISYDRFLPQNEPRELADKVGGLAMTLAEAENFHPEDGMVLANTTSVGMTPHTDATPLAKTAAAAKHQAEIAIFAMTLGSVSVTSMDLQSTDGLMRRNSTLICAPIMAESVDQMLIQMKRAKELGADIAEVRVDFLKNFSPRNDLETLIKQGPLPTLITYRPKWEGGQYDGDENKRQKALQLAMELGADFIDIELKVAQEFYNFIQGKKPEKVKIIVSSHNYECTPSIEDIGDLAVRIQATGADIVKIATTALDITDNARMFHIIANLQVPVIGLVMGERGLMSRVLAAKYGAFLTFGSIEAGVVSAPGQPTIKDLLELYNFRQIGADTKVYGVIGNPVVLQILYPHIHLQTSLDTVYTIPHKEDGLKCCNEVDPIAKEIGAISCMIRRPVDGKLKGYNVDYLGAIKAIEEALALGASNGAPASVSPLAGKLFVVVGAGGAGKALAYGAYEKGARVVVANRTFGKAKELASKVGGQVITLAELKDFHPEEGTILANATSVGMKPRIEDTLLPQEALKTLCVGLRRSLHAKIDHSLERSTGGWKAPLFMGQRCSSTKHLYSSKGSLVCLHQSNSLEMC
ncbi:hypothetical protein OIU76_016734 [Salix suchowensis]|nr:hypothetical protein OIU76_016734 [Salix suchowensis]